MNQRQHLIVRIERACRQTKDRRTVQLLYDVRQVLEADEDEIGDLVQRVDWLERETERRMPIVNEDFDEIMAKLRPR
jgi:hypothetical protein